MLQTNGAERRGRRGEAAVLDVRHPSGPNPRVSPNPRGSRIFKNEQQP